MNSIKLSELNRKIQDKSEGIPEFINVRGRSFRWVGGVWVHEGKATERDVVLLGDE